MGAQSWWVLEMCVRKLGSIGYHCTAGPATVAEYAVVRYSCSNC